MGRRTRNLHLSRGQGIQSQSCQSVGLLRQDRANAAGIHTRQAKALAPVRVLFYTHSQYPRDLRLALRLFGLPARQNDATYADVW